MKQPEFQRNEERGHVSYDVRSSKGYYYQVEMLDLDAVSCQCDKFVKGHRACKHMERAEREEKLFQETKNSQPENRYLNASLNPNGGFTLLKVANG